MISVSGSGKGSYSRCILGLMLVFLSLGVHAQNERKVIRQGIKSYDRGQYDEAETQFRKAADLNQMSFEADFNTGAALYKQEKYQETLKQYENLVSRAQTPAELAHVWHNMGNSLLEAQQYAQSIQAYRNSLRLNPSDRDTKYNLAYAMQKLQDQQQQQQQQQQQNQNQDQQNQDQDQQEQNQDQNQQQQQQQQKEQQAQQKEGDQAQQKEGDQGQQQVQPYQISKEDAERMLAAIQQQEKDVMEKVEKQKAAVAKVKTKKDW